MTNSNRTDEWYLLWLLANWETQDFFEAMSFERPSSVKELKRIIDEVYANQIDRAIPSYFEDHLKNVQ